MIVWADNYDDEGEGDGGHGGHSGHSGGSWCSLSSLHASIALPPRPWEQALLTIPFQMKRLRAVICRWQGRRFS